MSTQAFDESEWKDAFTSLLREIPNRLFPKLILEEVQDDALNYIEELLLKLMVLVLDKNPHSVQDLERIINSILPYSTYDNAKKKAKAALKECLESSHDSNISLIQIVNFVSNSSISNQQPNINLSNCSLILRPIITKIHQTCKLDKQTSVYLCALLESIADEIFDLVCKYVDNIGNSRIKLQDVQIALNADNLLMDLLSGKSEYTVTDYDRPFTLIDDLANLEKCDESNDGEKKNSTSVHVNIIKELIKEERYFLRELNLIIKVFREPFIRLLDASNSVPNTPTIASAQNFNDFSQSTATINSSTSTQITYINDDPIIKEDDIDLIFSNVTDIYEFSIDFLSMIEDTIEMNEECESIGMCFFETAESMEFDVFQIFAADLFERSKEENKPPHYHLKELFKNQKLVSCLSTSGKGVLLCIKYVLPKLLNGIIVHALYYFEYIKLLMTVLPKEDDRESLQQSEGLLNQLKCFLEKVRVGRNFKLNEGYLKLNKAHRERQFKNVKSKLDEMSKKIDGFNIQQHIQSCNEFIYEGVLSKARKGDKKGLRHIGENKSERYCFLFDGLLICCKILHNSISGVGANNFDFKKKEVYFIRNLEVCDSDSDSKSFELIYRAKDHEHKEFLIFLAKSEEEKDIWISNLLLLTQKHILERTLDSILSEEKRRIPLKLPDPKLYKFAEKDSESNIVFDSTSGKDLIKAATLTKLIERLTYHQYADPKFLKTFLTTYRSFCTPETLLDLLIERFNIPFDEESTENNHLSREELKRFKKEYLEPIQLRVLNALKLWIESHYYDLTEDMKKKLKDFLEQIQKKQKKNLKKWVDNLILRLTKKEQSNEEKKRKYLCDNLPSILHLYELERNEFNLLTIHPVEFSRQLTLYEFDLYCAVNTHELMNASWTKKEKHTLSPNILKLSQHNSRIIYWIEKEIVECPNLEERQAIISRLVEILQNLFELNNFNGLYEIIFAFGRASIYRLDLTFNHLPPRSQRFIKEMQELLNEGHFQRYQDHLRKINPPCVPFFGCYLTQILHLEEGNKDYIDEDRQLIHFSKRRKIAEIISEIQQYQNQPYCLNVYHELRDFIANLDPLQDRTEHEFNDYTYNKSLEIEPRGTTRPPKGERKYRDLKLKPSGIKHTFTSSTSLHHSASSNTIVSNHNHQTSTSSMMNNNDENDNKTTSNIDQSSNPQTPIHTPTSPISPTTRVHHSSSSSIIAIPPPQSPGYFENRAIMAPIILGNSNPAYRDQIQKHHQLISHQPFRVPNTPNQLYSSSIFNGSNILNKPSLSYTNNSTTTSGHNQQSTNIFQFPNSNQAPPPPLPPRSANRSSFSGIHQRTNSESSNTSNASPSNFILQSNSAFNTPLLPQVSGHNLSSSGNVFQFPNSNQAPPPPLPPKLIRTPNHSPSPFQNPSLFDTSNLSNISNLSLNPVDSPTEHRLPPPIPPRNA